MSKTDIEYALKHGLVTPQEGGGKHFIYGTDLNRFYPKGKDMKINPNNLLAGYRGTAEKDDECINCDYPLD
jgi:hypothetical protein